MKTGDCTVEILETNYRKSPLDALAYADCFEELGKLEEADRIRTTLDFAEKVQCIFRNLYVFYGKHAIFKEYDITLMNGYGLRLIGKFHSNTPLQCISACIAHSYKGRSLLSPTIGNHTLDLGEFLAPVTGDYQFFSIFSDCEKKVLFLEDEMRMRIIRKKRLNGSTSNTTRST
jgi:hypothetical protein